MTSRTSLQFATLGASDALLPLLRAARAEGHLCVATLEAGGHASEVARLTPGAVRDPAWELLLAPQRLLPHVDSERGAIEAAIDAVVVALDPLEAQTVGPDSLSLRQRREDQLRKLALAGVPLVLLVPCCEGIVGYELDMIRRDTNVLLFPYSSLLFHAGARRAQALGKVSAPDGGPHPGGTRGCIDVHVAQRAEIDDG